VGGVASTAGSSASDQPNTIPMSHVDPVSPAVISQMPCQ
jgi:hypothetical protein